MAFEKITVPSVRETFVREIENKILSGELKVGDKLPPARELCSIMGVSLTIVNAGISELASKGFVEVRPRHGTYVADYKTKGTPETLFAIMRYNGGNLSAHEVRSFCETRVALDPFVANLVIERASDEQLEDLGMVLQELRAATGIEECCTLITRFFHRLYTLTDNTILSLLYNSTIEPQKGMYAVFMKKNGTEAVLDNAEKIYSSLCARDYEQTRQFMLEGLMQPLEGETSIICDT